MLTLTHAAINELAVALAKKILYWQNSEPLDSVLLKIYPIPKGGIPVAYALLSLVYSKVVDDPAAADILVDDLIDSGRTRDRFTKAYPDKPFFALLDKTNTTPGWVVFPWEVTADGKDQSADDIVVRLLQHIGEDPNRGGLVDTPRRVRKAWQHWASGYGADIPSILKTFEDGADSCDEMVVVKDIPFYSHCEHHLAPFFGTVTVAYVPNGKIVGLSKLSRVVSAFARRLQVQERLTNQIADALQEHLAPLGVGIVVTARHLCMESRGIEQQGSITITSALRGVMRDSASARSEFLALSKK